MKEIVIRGKTYQPQKGDYILDDGLCFMFCAGDNRILKQEGFSSCSYIRLSKKAIKEIDFESLKKVEAKTFTKYYYK